MSGLSKGEEYAKDARQQLASLTDRIEKMRARQTDARAANPVLGGPADEIDWDKVYKEMQSRAKEVGAYIEEMGEELRNIDWQEVGERIEDYRKTSEKRLTELRDEGQRQWADMEKRYADLQAQAETGFWDLRAMVQRMSEGVAPLFDSEEAGKTHRYYFQKGPDGRWALVMDGAASPSLIFENKRDGLKDSRRYVRDHSPAELVIRRADGTFEHVHKYSA